MAVFKGRSRQSRRLRRSLLRHRVRRRGSRNRRCDACCRRRRSRLRRRSDDDRRIDRDRHPLRLLLLPTEFVTATPTAARTAAGVPATRVAACPTGNGGAGAWPGAATVKSPVGRMAVP